MREPMAMRSAAGDEGEAGWQNAENNRICQLLGAVIAGEAEMVSTPRAIRKGRRIPGGCKAILSTFAVASDDITHGVLDLLKGQIQE